MVEGTFVFFKTEKIVCVHEHIEFLFLYNSLI